MWPPSHANVGKNLPEGIETAQPAGFNLAEHYIKDNNISLKLQVENKVKVIANQSDMDKIIRGASLRKSENYKKHLLEEEESQKKIMDERFIHLENHISSLENVILELQSEVKELKKKNTSHEMQKLEMSLSQDVSKMEKSFSQVANLEARDEQRINAIELKVESLVKSMGFEDNRMKKIELDMRAIRDGYPIKSEYDIKHQHHKTHKEKAGIKKNQAEKLKGKSMENPKDKPAEKVPTAFQKPAEKPVEKPALVVVGKSKQLEKPETKTAQKPVEISKVMNRSASHEPGEVVTTGADSTASIAARFASGALFENSEAEHLEQFKNKEFDQSVFISRARTMGYLGQVHEPVVDNEKERSEEIPRAGSLAKALANRFETGQIEDEVQKRHEQEFSGKEFEKDVWEARANRLARGISGKNRNVAKAFESGQIDDEVQKRHEQEFAGKEFEKEVWDARANRMARGYSGKNKDVARAYDQGMIDASTLEREKQYIGKEFNDTIRTAG